MWSRLWTVDAVDTADIVHTPGTLDFTKRVNSVDNVSSVNSVHNFHNVPNVHKGPQEEVIYEVLDAGSTMRNAPLNCIHFVVQDQATRSLTLGLKNDDASCRRCKNLGKVIQGTLPWLGRLACCVLPSFPPVPCGDPSKQTGGGGEFSKLN